MTKSYPKDANPKKILIRMPNWIGDFIMATPIVAAVRKRFPQSEITVMCRGSVSALIQNDPNIDEIFSFKKSPILQRYDETKDVVEKLRLGAYDLGVLLTGSFSSAWLFWSGKVKVRLGFSKSWRRLLLNLPVAEPKEKQHLIKVYGALLAPLEISEFEIGKPRLYLTGKELLEARELLSCFGIKEKMRIIGINPGAAYGSAKCWLPERFSAVAKELATDKNTAVLFFGDEHGKGLVDQICLGLPENVYNLAGKTNLRMLMAIIKLCDVLLTNDSGPMHIGSAFGVPLVALFGSTCFRSTGPYNGETVISKQVPCAPCFKRECPIQGFPCMTGITVAEVVKAIQRELK